MTKAPQNGYLTVDTLLLTEGDRFFVRTGVNTCSLLGVPLYGKLQVLDIDTAAATVTIKVLVGPELRLSRIESRHSPFLSGRDRRQAAPSGCRGGPCRPRPPAGPRARSAARPARRARPAAARCADPHRTPQGRAQRGDRAKWPGASRPGNPPTICWPSSSARAMKSSASTPRSRASRPTSISSSCSPFPTCRWRECPSGDASANAVVQEVGPEACVRLCAPAPLGAGRGARAVRPPSRRQAQRLGLPALHRAGRAPGAGAAATSCSTSTPASTATSKSHRRSW